MERKRALWLIDGGYLFHTKSTAGHNYEFDYKKLRKWIEKEGPVWRAYYLNAVSGGPSEGQDSFHNWLQSAPPNGPKIIVQLYPLRRLTVGRVYCEHCASLVKPNCPNAPSGEEHRMFQEEQKGVDVGITTLALTLADQYDTLVLSSGDGDFLDAVEHLCQHGKRLELVVFKHGVSTNLQARADRIYWIDDFKEEVRKDF